MIKKFSILLIGTSLITYASDYKKKSSFTTKNAPTIFWASVYHDNIAIGSYFGPSEIFSLDIEKKLKSLQNNNLKLHADGALLFISQDDICQINCNGDMDITNLRNNTVKTQKISCPVFCATTTNAQELYIGSTQGQVCVWDLKNNISSDFYTSKTNSNINYIDSFGIEKLIVATYNTLETINLHTKNRVLFKRIKDDQINYINSSIGFPINSVDVGTEKGMLYAYDMRQPLFHNIIIKNDEPIYTSERLNPYIFIGTTKGLVKIYDTRKINRKVEQLVADENENNITSLAIKYNNLITLSEAGILNHWAK